MHVMPGAVASLLMLLSRVSLHYHPDQEVATALYARITLVLLPCITVAVLACQRWYPVAPVPPASWAAPMPPISPPRPPP